MPHYKLSQLWDVWCDQNWNPKGALHKNSDYGINVHANACCHKAWHRVSKWQLFVTLNYFPAWGCRQLCRVRQILAHLFLYLFWKNKVDLWSVTFLKLNGGFYSFDRRWFYLSLSQSRLRGLFTGTLFGINHNQSGHQMTWWHLLITFTVWIQDCSSCINLNKSHVQMLNCLKQRFEVWRNIIAAVE